MKKHPASILWPNPLKPDSSSIAEQTGTGSKKIKEQIIKDHLDVPEFVQTVKYALDPFMLFYLNVVPGLSSVQTDAKRTDKAVRTGNVDMFAVTPDKLSWKDQFSTMFDLLDKLSARKLAPNSTEAKNACIEWAKKCGAGTIEVFKSILKKDLRCGLGVSTFNKIKPGWISEFRISLAKPFNPDKLVWPCFVDPKYDGERCIVQITYDGSDASVMYLSRYGNVLYNYGKFSQDLIDIFRPLGSCVVDCEGISKLGFQHKMRTPKWDDPSFNTSHFQLIVFDFVPQKEWDDQKFEMSQYKRYEELTKLMSKNPNSDVRLVETTYVKNQKELDDVYEQWVAKGMEGVICKQPDGDYHFSTSSQRNPGWMKIKPKMTEDLVVVGIEEGEQGKIWEGKTGSIVVERKHNGNVVKVNVASGLTHNDHENIKLVGNQILYKPDLPGAEWTDIKGQTVEVIFDCITDDGSLRFPRIKNRGGTIIRTT